MPTPTETIRHMQETFDRVWHLEKALARIAVMCQDPMRDEPDWDALDAEESVRTRVAVLERKLETHNSTKDRP